MSTSELARRRHALGLTQREVAALLGIAPSSLAVVENGHRPAWPRLRREAARILGVTESELFPEGEVVRS